MDGREKVPFSLALSELALDDAKVEILLISLDFLVFFWLRPAPAPHPPIFWYIKGVQVIHIWAKFHLCLICNSRVLKFQMFLYQQKIQF